MVRIKVFNCDDCDKAKEINDRARSFMKKHSLPCEESVKEKRMKIVEEVNEPVSPVFIIGERKIVGFSPRHIKKEMKREIDKEDKMKNEYTDKSHIDDGKMVRGSLSDKDIKDVSNPSKSKKDIIYDSIKLEDSKYKPSKIHDKNVKRGRLPHINSEEIKELPDSIKNKKFLK